MPTEATSLALAMAELVHNALSPSTLSRPGPEGFVEVVLLGASQELVRDRPR